MPKPTTTKNLTPSDEPFEECASRIDLTLCEELAQGGYCVGCRDVGHRINVGGVGPFRVMFVLVRPFDNGSLSPRYVPVLAVDIPSSHRHSLVQQREATLPRTGGVPSSYLQLGPVFGDNRNLND